MAIIDRIKYDGPQDGSSWLVYKYPSEQFVLGSQLVVNSGQEVLFFKGGEALDLFGAGTHTLKTGNLPLLNKLVNLPFGGKTPFAAEVYYINKISRLDMGWGTATPMDFEDPKYGVPLSIRANGQYGITVPDARLFIIKLIGAVPNGSLTDYSYVGKFFNGHINTKLKSLIHKFMQREKISFLDISSYLDDLSKEAQNSIHDEFERFGVEIVNFFIETIKPRDDDNLAAIKAKRTEIAGLEMERSKLGDGFYSQRRSFDVMEGMAANPGAGGLANAGVGLGMGLGAAGHMGGAFAGIANNINPQANSPQQNSQSAVQCAKCGVQVPDSMKFCGGCGEKMPVGVVCPHCNKDVPAGMKFCGECGKPVGDVKCSDCGTENAPSMKFCGGCGKGL
jgi:membrane protease subunit (stomatin/prohibitin family)